MSKLTNIKFHIEGDKDYELGFTMESVKGLGNYSIQKRGEVSTDDLIKIALQVTKGIRFVSDAMAQDINLALMQSEVHHEGTILGYDELIQYLILLFVQTIDDAAKAYEPAEIVIHEDGTSSVTYKEKTYKLMFNRKDIENHDGNLIGVGFNSLLELYIAGSNLIKAALKSENGFMSTRIHEELFLSMWATKFEKEGESQLEEVVNGLMYHMTTVAESAVKKSKAVIKPIQH